MFVQKGDDTYKVYEQKNAIQKDHELGSYYISKEKYCSHKQTNSLLPSLRPLIYD